MSTNTPTFPMELDEAIGGGPQPPLKNEAKFTGRILLVEDHRDIAEVIGDLLERRGFTIDFAIDGVSGLHLAETREYDVILLDIMLAGIDGLELARRLRADTKHATPILILSARDTLEDKVRGFQAGADDYLVKPFALAELEARIRALIRRDRRRSVTHLLTIGDLTFDTETLQVQRAGQTLGLYPIGLRILRMLMFRAPQWVSKKHIESEVWGSAQPDPRILRTHISQLRKILDKPFDRPLIHTQVSVGYRIAVVPVP